MSLTSISLSVPDRYLKAVGYGEEPGKGSGVIIDSQYPKGPGHSQYWEEDGGGY